MRRSETGSAVSEFLLLMIPLTALAGASISIAWYGFAKVQLGIVAQETAWLAALPDVDAAEVEDFATERVSARLGMTRLQVTSNRSSELSEVSILIDGFTLSNLLSVVVPESPMVAHAAV